jgi:ABC-type branched-subunit amino acid transport system ATPase component
LLIGNIERSATGRTIAAVRVAEPAAGSIGLSPVIAKLKLFVLSAVVAGVGGVTLAVIDGGVAKTATNPLTGLSWLTVVVLMGVRRRGAAVFGGLLLIVFPQILSGGFHLPGFLPAWSGTRSTEIPAIFFGLGAASLARNPDGAIADFSHKQYLRRLKRRSKFAPAGTADIDPASIATQVDVVRGPAPLTRRSRDATAAAPLCEIVDVRAGYGEVTVLEGINLAIEAGTTTALLGANGAGKSTLCRTLAGLTTSEGMIRFQDVDISSLPANERANRGLVYAPESRGIFPGLSVEDNLRLAIPEDAGRDSAFERFPILKERRKLAAGMLSGGEQQMLALAPVLVRPPKLLVIDEPTLGLAPMVVATVMELLAEVRAAGTAVLIAEEKPRTVLDLADRVALIELGRLVWEGPASELSAEMLRSVYHLQSSADVPMPDLARQTPQPI